MTHNPSDLFAIIPVSSFGDANAKEAICIGPMKEVFEYIPQSVARRDAITAARAAEEEAKQIQAELDALPDPDDPNPFSGNSATEECKGEEPEPSDAEGDDGELPEALAKYSEAPELKPVKPKNYVSQPIAIQLNSEE